jgi:hypothetical protein
MNIRLTYRFLRLCDNSRVRAAIKALLFRKRGVIISNKRWVLKRSDVKDYTVTKYAYKFGKVETIGILQRMRKQPVIVIEP